MDGMRLEKKGMLSPFTIATSIITGAIFPLLGALIALDLDIINAPYVEGVALVMLGGFIAHWILAHAIHDLFHIEVEDRATCSKRMLIMLLVASVIILISIAIYLTIQRGWPVMIFAFIGGIVSLYAEGLMHRESQMAFGAMFLVIGGFYVQVGRLDLSYFTWFQVICIALFAFVSQYGWLLFYRLDDYGWSKKMKNKSILVAKSGLFFLILYLISKIFIV